MVSTFSKYHTFAFDIETTGLNPIDSRILLAQIAFPDVTYVINANLDLSPIMPFFSDNKWLKIIQNAKFDTKFLLHYYKTKTHNIFDTMLAEKLITSGENVGLASLAQKYLNVTLDKNVRDSFIEMNAIEMFSQEQLRYASKDAEVLFGIKEKQEADIAAFGIGRVAEVEFELAPVVASMELVGVPIDQRKWRDKLANYEQEHENSRLEMHRILFDDGGLQEQLGLFTRDSINLNSPKQIKEALQKLGIDIDKTGERELAVLNHPVAKELLNYRSLQKILTSYGEGFLEKIHPFTNRIHADFQQIGTATGRFACKDPNLQQMPEEFRHCVSLPDHKIVVADYSQIELRILAEYSGDPKFLAAFESGEDLHRATAATMFDIVPDIVTKDQRFIAKTINFGLSYGMGANKLMDILNSGKPEAQKLSFTKVRNIMNKYKSAYSGVTEWLAAAGQQAFRQGYSTTMLGRRRWYERPDPNTPDWETTIAHIKRQGANSPIQGTNADITKLAMLNLYHDLQTYGYSANIILQVHDEIGVLAHKSNAEAVKALVVESMERSAQELLKTVPVKVDAYVSDEWRKG